MSIPIVIVHTGNPDYLQAVITHASKYSRTVVLLGDESNTSIKNAIHIPLSALKTNKLITFESSFVNYSTCNSNFERFCFSRLFYIREWMRRNKITSVVHLDSDCLILRNVDELFNGQLALLYNQKDSGLGKMSGSIAISCLTTQFIDDFIELCNDIYVTKTKLELVQEKIKYHRSSRSPGGVCDMTLYYILAHTLNPKNLLDIQEDGSSYDDNINDSLGFNGQDTFVLNGRTKVVKVVDSKVVALGRDGREIRLNNLHYQGNSKKLIIETTNMLARLQDC